MRRLMGPCFPTGGLVGAWLFELWWLLKLILLHILIVLIVAYFYYNNSHLTHIKINFHS